MIFCIFVAANGLVAERLGGGLQNRIQRFESARDLKKPERNSFGFFREMVK